MTGDEFFPCLAAAAARPYRHAGRFAWHFARGKLARDPVFRELLEHGLIPDGARVLDLGCGQGLLAALLLAAREHHGRGLWPRKWPAPPRLASWRGIELNTHDVDRARGAIAGGVSPHAALPPGGAPLGLGRPGARGVSPHAALPPEGAPLGLGRPGAAGGGQEDGTPTQVERGDIRDADFGEADVVVVLDVLHYIELPWQDEVLRRARDALSADGLLLLRVGDAGGGWRFRLGTWVDRAVARARGVRGPRLHCRRLDQWAHRLATLGLSVESLPMSRGTLFANVLLVARRGIPGE